MSDPEVAEKRRRSTPGGAFAHRSRRHPRATAVLALASVALVFFAWRVVVDARRAIGAIEPDLALWMSPRYVAKSRNLPREDVFRIMRITDEKHPDGVPETLADVLERTGLTLGELQRRIEIAEAAARTESRSPDRDGAGR